MRAGVLTKKVLKWDVVETGRKLQVRIKPTGIANKYNSQVWSLFRDR